jgi:hypothetical protein
MVAAFGHLAAPKLFFQVEHFRPPTVGRTKPITSLATLWVAVLHNIPMNVEQGCSEISLHDFNKLEGPRLLGFLNINLDGRIV